MIHLIICIKDMSKENNVLVLLCIASSYTRGRYLILSDMWKQIIL